MTMKKVINPRKEKVRLLQNIDRGTVNINDLLSKKLELRVGYGPDNCHFINGHPVSEAAFLAEEMRQALTNPNLEFTVEYGPEIYEGTEEDN